MPKEELLEFEGLVTEILPDARFRMTLIRQRAKRNRDRQGAEQVHLAVSGWLFRIDPYTRLSPPEPRNERESY